MNGWAKISLAAAMAAALLGWHAGVAGAAEKIDVSGAWEAYSDTDKGQGKGKKFCYMGSPPAKSQGEYSRRGDVHILITHWPAEGTVNVVSVVAGYSYKKGSAVTVVIDGKTAFKLFTDGGQAFANTAADDTALVKAMRAGKSMVIFGMSGRGTETTDTYSLKGFSKAHNAISKACGVG